MKTYLKVKIKSLAVEAQIIRKEERRVRAGYRGRPVETRGEMPAVFWGLRDHRTRDVRSEARSALLAYGFIRGRTLAAIEGSAKTTPDWKRVEVLVRKYGNGFDPAVFKDWRDGKSINRTEAQDERAGQEEAA